MRQPMMSGHCAAPSTATPERSHQRCHDMGAGNRANPKGEFSPCPCGCHLDHENLYECGNCGRPLREAPMWPNDFANGDKFADPDEMVYVHIDAVTGRAIGEEC